MYSDYTAIYRERRTQAAAAGVLFLFIASFSFFCYTGLVQESGICYAYACPAFRHEFHWFYILIEERRVECHLWDRKADKMVLSN